MKKGLLPFAAIAALGAASTAMADGYDPSLDIVLDLGSFSLDSLSNGGSPVVFNVSGPSNVVGFSFSGNVTGITGNASWASDLQLGISIDGSDPFLVGGISTPRDLDWDFQGGSSTTDGFYSSGPHIVLKETPVPEGADWELSFMNDWNSTAAATMNWTDVQIIVHRVPAPGALALLGLAGLVGTRRRHN